MLLLLLLGIGFYLYKTGQLQNFTQSFQENKRTDSNEARRIFDLRYATGQITVQEYNKIKSLL